LGLLLDISLHGWLIFIGAAWQHGVVAAWVMALAVIGILLLLRPKTWRYYCFGGICFVPLFFYSPAHPKMGQVWFTMLDVGQGLATVVKTAHHVLIYDTGPKYDSFDAGNAIVVPFLRTRGINKIDILMVSHGDNDHIGGANAIIAEFNVKAIMTSVPQRFPNLGAHYCWAGQNWQWDGVNFQVFKSI